MSKIDSRARLLEREEEVMKILALFLDKGLDFIVVGGYAISTYKKRFSIDLDIVVGEEHLEKFENILKKEGYSLIDIDGVRIQLEKGWALLRAANTSPHVKCRFEGETKEDLERIERDFLGLFLKLGVPIKKDHYRELGLN